MALITCLLVGCSHVAHTSVCSGMISYVAPGTNGHADVYSINPDNSQILSWTENPGFDGYPSWSPDGQKMALISSHEGSSQLVVIDEFGSHNIDIGQDDTPRHSTSWSRDGHKLAFISVTPEFSSGTFNLGIIDLDDHTNTYTAFTMLERYTMSGTLNPC